MNVIDKINISVKGTNFNEIIINNSNYSNDLYSEKINLLDKLEDEKFKISNVS